FCPGSRPRGRRGPAHLLERPVVGGRGGRGAAAALLGGGLPRHRDPPLPRARCRHRRVGVRRAERRDLREPRPPHGRDLGGARGHPAGADRLRAVGRALDRARRRRPRAGGPARRAEARTMSPRLLRGGVVAAALAAGTLLLVVIVNTAHWVDTTFPGFFVMSNRVVPSIALRDWSDGDPALVFPTERLPRYRRRVLLGLYGAFALLAAVYEVVLGSPSAYTAVHLLATATHGLGALTIIAVVIYSLVTSPSALVRRRVSVVALGTLAAFLLPAALLAASACYGRQAPLNAGAFTAFLFPVSLAY